MLEFENKLQGNLNTNGADSAKKAIESTQAADGDAIQALSQAGKPESKQEKRKNKGVFVLVDTFKLEYIGEQEYKFSDLKGYKYALNKGDIIVVPKGSFGDGLAYKKTLFKRVQE